MLNTYCVLGMVLGTCTCIWSLTTPGGDDSLILQMRKPVEVRFPKAIFYGESETEFEPRSMLLQIQGSRLQFSFEIFIVLWNIEQERALRDLIAYSSCPKPSVFPR